ncbi:tyrosine protein phosphatase [Bowmanella denitrificans]|uniref:protein-tyrosine-phosphatase n=1 Tax=Bowmanella denitrificans TaxID=366582 RepID=A0ABP3G9E7_9ALTE
MIDLHAHLIPGIDDGASDAQESLALLRLAHQQGVTRIVCTPHWYPGRFDNDRLKILAGLGHLQSLCDAEQINIELRSACEARVCAELLPAVEKAQLLFLGELNGNKVLLLEFPHSHIPPGADRLIRWLMKQSIVPMIAHPERNRDLQANPDLIRPFKQAGCLFQLTAAALVGEMGETAQILGERWLKDGLFDIIASDTHSVKRRPPRMQQAFSHTAQLLGEETAERLMVTTPGAICRSLFS